MGCAETQRLQQQVDHLTNLVSQLMEAQAAPVALPDSPLRASATVPVALLEKYDGNPNHCQAVLMQCGLYVEEHPECFQEEIAWVRLVISLLTERTCEWATTLWLDDSPLAFKEIFEISRSRLQSRREVIQCTTGNSGCWNSARLWLDFAGQRSC